jgi:hypothetical protein
MVFQNTTPKKNENENATHLLRFRQLASHTVEVDDALRGVVMA